MKHSLTRAALGAATALMLVAPAFAQPAPPAGGMMRDPFGDTTVLRKDAEAQAAARFDALDTSKDAVLSPEELAAARPARPAGEARPERREGGSRRGGMGRMMDANGDGKVTRDEFVAGTLRRYDMMDADHDGQLTKAERQTAFAAMRARMEERMRAMAESQMGGSGGDD